MSDPDPAIDLAGHDIQFFEKRPKVYPRDATLKGKFRRLKWVVMAALLAIYYFTPFLRWDRGPHVPDQAVLIDIPHSRGYFFMFEIWPQEVYVLTGLLVLAAIALFAVTSVLGRVWCGYACPQTVWTDLFVKVEYWIQGDRNARMKRDAAPLTFEKVWKKLATHVVWLVIGLMTGGAWVFYFHDAPTLLHDLLHFQAPTGAVGWMAGLTLSTYFMAGYARENICTYACPYARFQSAMFDKDTLVISYDRTRGEPRGKHKQGDGWEGRGHCIDCKQCVVVCPVGIDIRNGLQLPCIACGLCVDACNDVMDKVGLPRGLVRYDTDRNQRARDDARACGKTYQENIRIIRPRTIYYAVILLVVGGLVLYALLSRQPFEMHVLHDRNPLYVKLSDGSIRNNYAIKLLNKTHHDKDFSVQLVDAPQAQMKFVGVDGNIIHVPADAVSQFRVSVDFPASPLLQARRTLVLMATDLETGKTTNVESLFVTEDKR
ncbi:MAG: cytochrome c oxidase accessory protein CcoG [Alphaproteobacteria bacterium]|nr:cytochrome c oxidase accessory protein CcoG [Alphaproteobacteria bacterium]NDC55900.1 cytochrome c oxidase accessory protein CcoG [Alphaproteobacteria bacterium]NDG04297.1 cytochrome c oxidase accessory protein CcoG [Alphaproteobacteria bacterium]